MDTRIVAALIAVTGTLLGVWIGSLLSKSTSHAAIQATHQNALDLIQRQEFNKAAANFRVTFTNELTYFKDIVDYDKYSTVTEDEIIKRLESTVIAFNNACILFRCYLTESQLVGFDNAWKEYCHPQGGEPKQMPGPFLEYFVDDPPHKSLPLIIEKMEKLLSFAKPK
jgi:hypothetical protein